MCEKKTRIYIIFVFDIAGGHQGWNQNGPNNYNPNPSHNYQNNPGNQSGGGNRRY